jgi:hypothetical protein
MFTEQKIPNDLFAVAKRIHEYYKAQPTPAETTED